MLHISTLSSRGHRLTAAPAIHPRAGGWADDGRGKNTSNMPEGCYCDMRGWTCPLHKGHEKWRQSHVFTQHVVRVRVRARVQAWIGDRVGWVIVISQCELASTAST